MSRSPPHLGLPLVLCVLGFGFWTASALADEIVLCKTWTGSVKARYGSCAWGETEIALPENTDTLADLNCSTDQIAKYDGTQWVCAEDPDCPTGYAPLGGGACLDMRTQLAEQECASGAHFVDLGQTVFDCDTSLEWEKKVLGSSGSCLDEVHSVSATCDWVTATGAWVDKLNTTCSDDPSISCTTDADCSGVGGPCGYAGHTNWRVPEVGENGGTAELETIVDTSLGECDGGSGPCIDPIFGPTAAGNYWSSVTSAISSLLAGVVDFSDGSVNDANKGGGRRVRAVRPGP